MQVPRNRIRPVLVLGLQALLLVAIPRVASGASVEIVAQSGQVAPGTGGAVFDWFSVQQRGAFPGDVVFEGALSGSGVTASNDRGIWIGRPGSLAVVARKGDPAPGVPGAVLGSPSPGFGIADVILTNGSDLIMQGLMSGLTVVPDNERAIWARSGSGPLALVARTGSQVPGAPNGVLYQSFVASSLQLDAFGRIALRAYLSGAGVTAANNTAFLAERAGALELLAREGAVAPGLPGMVPFAEAQILARDPAGSIVMGFGAGAGFGADQGLWLASEAGGPSAYALVGAAAPGGSSFTAFHRVCRDQGRIYVEGRVQFSDRGIWSGTEVDLALLVREGDPAPGVGPGVTFADLSLIACAGDNVLVHGWLAGSGVTSANNTGLWLWRGANPELVAREGNPIPARGLIPTPFVEFGSGSVNRQGDVVFQAPLEVDPQFGIPSDYGVFYRARGRFETVAREGRSLTIAAGDSRVVSYLLLVPGLDDAARFAISASFDGGSAAVLRVPEPESGPLGAAVLAVLVLTGWARPRGTARSRAGCRARF